MTTDTSDDLLAAIKADDAQAVGRLLDSGADILLGSMPAISPPGHHHWAIHHTGRASTPVQARMARALFTSALSPPQRLVALCGWLALYEDAPEHLERALAEVEDLNVLLGEYTIVSAVAGSTTPSIMARLLEAGADAALEARAGDGVRQAGFNREHGLEIVALLRAAGCPPRPAQATAAVAINHHAFVDHLLAETPYVDGFLKATFIEAMKCGQKALAMRLVEAGLIADFEVFERILTHDDEALLVAVIEQGADVDASSAAGVTPLMLAAFYRRTQAAERLIAAGADVNAECAGRHRSVLYTTLAMRSPVLPLLLDAGLRVPEAHEAAVASLLERL
mgnify:FL=1